MLETGPQNKERPPQWRLNSNETGSKVHQPTLVLILFSPDIFFFLLLNARSIALDSVGCNQTLFLARECRSKSIGEIVNCLPSEKCPCSAYSFGDVNRRRFGRLLVSAAGVQNGQLSGKPYRRTIEHKHCVKVRHTLGGSRSRSGPRIATAGRLKFVKLLHMMAPLVEPNFITCSPNQSIVCLSSPEPCGHPRDPKWWIRLPSMLNRPSSFPPRGDQVQLATRVLRFAAYKRPSQRGIWSRGEGDNS